MKYKTIVLIILLVIPSVSFASSFPVNLYYGVQDKTDVIALQEFLTVQGDYSGPITGNFYSLTLAGVKAFQTQNSISPVSGYFGILSRGVANSLLEPLAPIEETGTTTQAVTPVTHVTQPIPVTIVGSTQPVNSPAPAPAPVVQSPVMNETIPKWNIQVTQDTNDIPGGVQPRITVNVTDANGVYAKQPVTVTTDDPDLPSSFTINAPGQVQFFCVAPTYDGFPNQGCKSIEPSTPGTYNLTFTVEDVSVSKQITIQ